MVEGGAMRLRPPPTTACLVVFLTAVIVTGGAASPAGAAGLLGRLKPNLAPRHGVLLGVYAKKRAGRTHGQELRHVERQLGRRVAIDHVYLHFDDPLVDRQVRASVGRGRIPLINWAPEDSQGPISWRSIANGAHDRAINRQARAVHALHRPV